jgi:predicted nuclease with TOPRIM domain
MITLETVIARMMELETNYYELQTKYQELIHEHEELKLKARHEEDCG